MSCSKSNRKKLALGLAAVMVIMPLSYALAAVQSLTNSAEFVTPVALSSPVNLRFGKIDVGFTTGEPTHTSSAELVSTNSAGRPTVAGYSSSRWRRD